jgi:hypothetical protein
MELEESFGRYGVKKQRDGMYTQFGSLEKIHEEVSKGEQHCITRRQNRIQ